MGRKIGAGVFGGLAGGIVFDGMMRALPLDGGGTSMISFAATIVHAPTPGLGWLVYPVYGAAIGAVFGWLFQEHTLEDLPAALWGALYGGSWWIVAELVLVPALLGAWPFSASALAPIRNAAVPLLAGHVVYGLILGVAWAAIVRGSTRQGPGAEPRAAHPAAPPPLTR